MIVFDCSDPFIWITYWFISWSLFWPTSLTVTLGGTAGGFPFINISARVFNASLCPLTNFTKGIDGAVLCSAKIRYCAAR